MAGPFRKCLTSNNTVYLISWGHIYEGISLYICLVDRQQLDESIHRNLLAGIRPRTANAEGAKFHWPKRVSHTAPYVEEHVTECI